MGEARVDSPARRPARFAYVGAYTRDAPGGGRTVAEGIAVYAVDPSTGGLSLIQTVPSDNPSFLAFDPMQRFLYAVNEIEGSEGRRTGRLAAFAIEPETGRLTLLNREASGGAGPTHLAVDPAGGHVAVAHYVGATFAVLPIAGDGSLGQVSDTVAQAGSGPNRERQEAPHPHGVTFDPAGRFVAAADLGTDTVQIFRLDTASGRLERVSAASTAPGAGPRHIAFHPNGRFLYVINELDATVTAFTYDAASGEIGETVQTIPTVPEGVAATTGPAEIAVHPSGRFLYGSNRGLTGATAPEADSVVAYAVDEATGRLSLIGYATEGIDFPRHFAIDPTGTWLYVCNQQADSIVQFAIDQATGELSSTGSVTESPTPVCIVFKTA